MIRFIRLVIVAGMALAVLSSCRRPASLDTAETVSPDADAGAYIYRVFPDEELLFLTIDDTAFAIDSYLASADDNVPMFYTSILEDVLGYTAEVMDGGWCGYRSPGGTLIAVRDGESAVRMSGGQVCFFSRPAEMAEEGLSVPIDIFLLLENFDGYTLVRDGDRLYICLNRP